MLGVDTENPSGAYALYQRLGFEPSERMITHEIEVGRALGGRVSPQPVGPR
jgi:hypothetical protein